MGLGGLEPPTHGLGNQLGTKSALEANPHLLVYSNNLDFPGFLFLSLLNLDLLRKRLDLVLFHHRF
ncbi:hypothetical protein KDI_44760 [Dictyobacter arantiisoli]|uniref:Uncharacterized protein n=1 Tax=Dictyobacter arantiisoli TaxID=2014874 RepID=A0A5A5THX7_9CHLR|nr:hypothetical protein KDI_44760 [Dictyobacter arantiisoli]